MKKIVEVKHVSKSYHNKNVLKDLSFSMQEGEFLALLGPNGAGKSTLISILCSLLQFEQGNITVCGHVLSKNNLQIRQNIGVVFQNSILDNILSLKNNLRLRCGFYNLTKKEAISRVNELANLCGLEDFMNQKVSTLSGGQRRKGDIARALIAKPSLLILDEPTTGLDPHSRLQIWQTIERLRKETSMAILLTTHYMEEAEKADQIIMMNHGEIITSGKVSELKKRFGGSTLTIYSNTLPMLQKTLKKRNITYVPIKGAVEIPIHKNANVLSLLRHVELYTDKFEVHSSSVEDAFLKIIKE